MNGPATNNAGAESGAVGAHSNRSAAAVEAWIVHNLEEALELEAGEVDVHQPFDTYGLDSTEAVNLVSGLEDWLGLELPANLVYQFDTAAKLSRHLAGEQPADG